LTSPRLSGQAAAKGLGRAAAEFSNLLHANWVTFATQIQKKLDFFPIFFCREKKGKKIEAHRGPVKN
jgi:hypothetical protein